MSDYRYTESGLDNVLIQGMLLRIDEDGDEVVAIPNVNGLHRVIAHGIVQQTGGLTPRELRFLRTEIGLTQAQLAEVVHVDAQTVGRWERGETPLQPSAEALIRLLVVDKLSLDLTLSVQEVSRRCMPSATVQTITIDGHDASHYRLAA
jgi:DNA-binding transcriptional regulator YiaG